MRVITGTARGRRLNELKGKETRPTADRVKEGMFNINQFDIEGRRVLDLFGGTGQLGIECLSRGAAHATFVDARTDAVKLIRENLGDQGITAGFRILSETESKMMTSKAADVVLNQWHTDRAEDMQLLWNSFCEKDDTDLERLLLELHKFLGTVPFRENWVQQVQQELQKPLEDSTYYQMLSAGMEQNLQMILRLANEAADTASELYESVTDNKALAWIEADVHMLEKTLRMVQQQESDAEKLLEPYAKLKQERTGKRFSSSKKGLLNEEALARAKSLREMYKGMIEDVALQIETIYP